MLKLNHESCKYIHDDMFIVDMSDTIETAQTDTYVLYTSLDEQQKKEDHVFRRIGRQEEWTLKNFIQTSQNKK